MFYHAIEEGLVDPRRMIQIGIRSPVPREVHDWTAARGVVMLPAQSVHETGPAAVVERIVEVVGDAPVYLSIDIDVLDPAFAPGTGTPEIGGLASWQVQAILRQLSGLHFVGMDWSKWRRLTTPPRSPRSPARRSPGNISVCSACAADAPPGGVGYKPLSTIEISLLSRYAGCFQPFSS